MRPRILAGFNAKHKQHEDKKESGHSTAQTKMINLSHHVNNTQTIRTDKLLESRWHDYIECLRHDSVLDKTIYPAKSLLIQQK